MFVRFVGQLEINVLANSINEQRFKMFDFNQLTEKL
jgi:hypothetical protein